MKLKKKEKAETMKKPMLKMAKMVSKSKKK